MYICIYIYSCRRVYSSCVRGSDRMLRHFGTAPQSKWSAAGSAPNAFILDDSPFWNMHIYDCDDVHGTPSRDVHGAQCSMQQAGHASCSMPAIMHPAITHHAPPTDQSARPQRCGRGGAVHDVSVFAPLNEGNTDGTRSQHATRPVRACNMQRGRDALASCNAAGTRLHHATRPGRACIMQRGRDALAS